MKDDAYERYNADGRNPPDRAEVFASAIFYTLSLIASALGGKPSEIYDSACETEAVRPRRRTDEEKRELTKARAASRAQSLRDEIRKSIKGLK